MKFWRGQKFREGSRAHVYQNQFSPSGQYHAAQYKERFYGNGMCDVIRLSDGHVIKQISEFLHKEEFSNPLVGVILPCFATYKLTPNYGASTVFTF